MREALINLITLLQSEIYTPVGEALRSSGWVQNIFNFFNTLLSKLFDAFHDAPTTGITNFFTFDFVSAIITTLILIWFISILVKIFKLSFKTLKNVYLSIVEVGPIEKGSSSRTWRKQWKRKK